MMAELLMAGLLRLVVRVGGGGWEGEEGEDGEESGGGWGGHGLVEVRGGSWFGGGAIDGGGLRSVVVGLYGWICVGERVCVGRRQRLTIYIYAPTSSIGKKLSASRRICRFYRFLSRTTEESISAYDYEIRWLHRS